MRNETSCAPIVVWTVLALVLGDFSTGRAVADEADFGAAFERMKTPAGTSEILDDQTRGEEVVFSLTGEGTVLVERFANMSSV